MSDERPAAEEFVVTTPPDLARTGRALGSMKNGDRGHTALADAERDSPSFRPLPSRPWNLKGPDLAGLIMPLLEALAKLADLESTYLTVFDWDRREQEVRFVFSAGEIQVDEGHRVPMPPELSPEVFPGVTRSLQAITGSEPDSWVAKRLGLKAYISVPVLVAKHRLFGMLCGASEQPREISETVVAMFESLADIMAEHVVRLHLEATEARAMAAEYQLSQGSLLLEGRLDDAERVKNELTAVGNHELRTPLTAISGAASLLDQGGERLTPEDRATLLAIIVRQSEKMTSIIRNLVLADETPSVDRHASAEVRSTVDDVVEQLEKAGDYTCPYSLDVPPGVLVHIDPGALRAVLINLFDNACKFSPPGAPVTVNAERVGPYVRISITSSGGIEPDDLERIFDRFLQLEPSNTRPTGGLGLGLYVVRRMLEAYGGTIEVENVEQTITFTVVLSAAPDGSLTQTDRGTRGAAS